jgi:hypothetical protein
MGYVLHLYFGAAGAPDWSARRSASRFAARRQAWSACDAPSEPGPAAAVTEVPLNSAARPSRRQVISMLPFVTEGKSETEQNECGASLVPATERVAGSQGFYDNQQMQGFTK